MTGELHVATASLALITGLAVFARQKGTARHRLLGRVYAGLMVATNFFALATFRQTGTVGVFHVLAVLSLITVVAGLAFALTRRPRRSWAAVHGYLMSWSWVGLLAAGLSQLATAVLPGRPGLSVGGTTFLVCLIAGLIIHGRMPRTLAALYSGGRRTAGASR